MSHARSESVPEYKAMVKINCARVKLFSFQESRYKLVSAKSSVRIYRKRLITNRIDVTFNYVVEFVLKIILKWKSCHITL